MWEGCRQPQDPWVPGLPQSWPSTCPLPVNSPSPQDSPSEACGAQPRTPAQGSLPQARPVCAIACLVPGGGLCVSCRGIGSEGFRVDVTVPCSGSSAGVDPLLWMSLHAGVHEAGLRL